MKLLKFLVTIFLLFCTYDSINYLLKHVHIHETLIPGISQRKVEKKLLPVEEKWKKVEILIANNSTLCFLCIFGTAVSALIIFVKFSSVRRRWFLRINTKIEREIDATKRPNLRTESCTDFEKVENKNIGEIHSSKSSKHKLSTSKESSKSSLHDETAAGTLLEEFDCKPQESFPFKIEVKCECNLLCFEERLINLEECVKSIDEAKNEILDKTNQFTLQVSELQHQINTLMVEQSIRSRSHEMLPLLSTEESNTSINKQLLPHPDLSDIITDIKKKFSSEELLKTRRLESEEEPQRERRSPWAGDTPSSEFLKLSVIEHQRLPSGFRQKSIRLASSPTISQYRKK